MVIRLGESRCDDGIRVMRWLWIARIITLVSVIRILNLILEKFFL